MLIFSFSDSAHAASMIVPFPRTNKRALGKSGIKKIEVMIVIAVIENAISSPPSCKVTLKLVVTKDPVAF
jgi:hypothetical protein